MNNMAWWERLDEARRAAAIAAAAVLVVALAYPPLLRGLGQRHRRLAELTASITEARQAADQQLDRARQLERAQQQLAPWMHRIGGGQSMARVLDALNQQAQAHQLQVVAVQPRAAGTSEGKVSAGRATLRAMPLELQVSGRYRQIGEFLGGLAEAPFLAEVRALRVSSSEHAQVLDGRIDLVVYLEEAG